MTGMCRVVGSDFSRLVTSHPSISGRLMSIRIKSGDLRLSRSKASLAVSGDHNLVAFAPKRLDSMSRFISLSSTRRIFGIGPYGPKR